MKAHLIALCALTLGALAMAEPVTITPTADQAKGLEFVTAQFNAAEKVKFDASTKAAYEVAQAALPADQRVPYDAAAVAQYVPVTAAQYAARRFSEVLDSYAKAEVAARIAEPSNQALIEAIAKLPTDQLEAIKAQLREAVGQ